MRGSDFDYIRVYVCRRDPDQHDHLRDGRRRHRPGPDGPAPRPLHGRAPGAHWGRPPPAARSEAAAVLIRAARPRKSCPRDDELELTSWVMIRTSVTITVTALTTSESTLSGLHPDQRDQHRDGRRRPHHSTIYQVHTSRTGLGGPSGFVLRRAPCTAS